MVFVAVFSVVQSTDEFLYSIFITIVSGDHSHSAVPFKGFVSFNFNASMVSEFLLSSGTHLLIVEIKKVWLNLLLSIMYCVIFLLEIVSSIPSIVELISYLKKTFVGSIMGDQLSIISPFVVNEIQMSSGASIAHPLFVWQTQ